MPDLSPTVLLLILAATAVLSLPRGSWRFLGLLTTVVHELGHAFAALVSGQRLRSIVIRGDHSGTTTTLSRGRWPAVWSGFWGYPMPAVAGAALVACGFAGWGSAAIAGASTVVVASLLFIRNITGAIITLSTAALGAGIVLLAPAESTGYVAVVLGLVLLVGSVRALGNLIHLHVRRRAALRTSDAHLLHRATGVPAALWILLFAAVISAAWYAAWLPAAAVVLNGA